MRKRIGGWSACSLMRGAYGGANLGSFFERSSALRLALEFRLTKMQWRRTFSRRSTGKGARSLAMTAPFADCLSSGSLAHGTRGAQFSLSGAPRLGSRTR